MTGPEQFSESSALEDARDAWEAELRGALQPDPGVWTLDQEPTTSTPDALTPDQPELTNVWSVQAPDAHEPAHEPEPTPEPAPEPMPEPTADPVTHLEPRDVAAEQTMASPAPEQTSEPHDMPITSISNDTSDNDGTTGDILMTATVADAPAITPTSSGPTAATPVPDASDLVDEPPVSSTPAIDLDRQAYTPVHGASLGMAFESDHPGFKRQLRGYRRNDVNKYIGELQADGRRMMQELLELRERHTRAETEIQLSRRELAWWRSQREMLDTAIAKAHGRAINIEQEAQLRAQAVEREAQQTARGMVDSVRRQADEILAQARSEAQRRVEAAADEVTQQQLRAQKLGDLQMNMARSVREALALFESGLGDLDMVKGQLGFLDEQLATEPTGTDAKPPSVLTTSTGAAADEQRVSDFLEALPTSEANGAGLHAVDMTDDGTEDDVVDTPTSAGLNIDSPTTFESSEPAEPSDPAEPSEPAESPAVDTEMTAAVSPSVEPASAAEDDPVQLRPISVTSGGVDEAEHESEARTIVVEASPLPTFSSLTSFQRELSALDAVEQVFVRSFTGDRARVQMRVAPTDDLTSLLADSLPYECDINEEGDTVTVALRNAGAAG